MADTRKELVEDLRRKPPSDDRDKLINMARRGEFHDYKSERFDQPKVELHRRLLKAGYCDLAAKVVAGDYDDAADEIDKERMRSWDPGLYDKLHPEDARRRGKA